ncbi:glycosyltransferase family 2 protein [Candidatus Woesebacteria bacterium]|nr:MAG: glycosyltransferase family 2 protein [Candidatus Woesebacteria bacterium]
MKDLFVSIVIPNYNGEELLLENIPHVLSAFGDSGNRIIEVIVVDDCSTDKSIEVLKNNFPDVKLVKHKTNRRFSAACNTGARMAKGELICLLNTDVKPAKNFLHRVIPHFKDNLLFAVSLNEKGYSWASGNFCKGFVEHEGGKKSSHAHHTFWVNGGSGVFVRDVWMKLKGMDEELYPPFYWEDIDLSYRAAKRGYKLLWEPHAMVLHEHESTNKVFKTSYRQRIQERNQLLFIWRNITSSRMFRKHIKGLLNRIVLHPGYLRIVFMAILKFAGVHRLRKIEKKESVVSDESIFARF